MHADIMMPVEGATYDALLRFALSVGGTFVLVQRDQLNLAESGRQVLARLSPDLVTEERVAAWPGTLLDRVRATLRRYRVNDHSISVLSSASRALFSWQQPDLPEDLAFFDSKHACWLTNIAHEREAFVDPEVIDLHALTDAVPAIHLSRVKGHSRRA